MHRSRSRAHLVSNPNARDLRCLRFGVGPTPVGQSVIVWAQGGVLALWLATNDPGSALEFVCTRHSMDFDVRTAHQLRQNKESLFKRDDEGACRLLSRIFEGTPFSDRQDDVGRELDNTDWFDSDTSARIPVLVRASPFELLVWQGLCDVPRATVITYSDLASRVGRPGAARAVGSAMARNGVAVLIACHRVTPKSGGVGQFRWGDQIKRKLIEWERGS